MVDGASLERVAISNLVMTDIESPIFIRLGNRGRSQAVPKPEHFEGISISDIVATGARRASSITGIEDLELRAFSAAPPSGEEPTVALRNVRRGFLQGLRAQPGTGILCKLSGAQTARISATGNDFSEAASPFHFAPEVAPAVLSEQANILRHSP